MPPAKKRVRYTQEQKDSAYKLFDQGRSITAIAEETGIGDMTLAAWKRDREIGQELAAEKTLQEENESLKLQLELVELTNKFLRRYGRAESAEDKLEVEVQYGIAFAKIFAGDWPFKRLSDTAAEEESE